MSAEQKLKAALLAIAWIAFLLVVGPYLWHHTRVWLLQCPLIEHEEGCACYACRTGNRPNWDAE